MAEHRKSEFRGRGGFTLLEMSIVLIIIGVVVSGIVTTFAASLQKRQAEETLMKLEAINKMLYSYRIAFNRLPCPADITKPMTDADFGVEAENAGTCRYGTPTANFFGNGAGYGYLITGTSFSSADGGTTYDVDGIVAGAVAEVKVGNAVATDYGVCAGVYVTQVGADTIRISNPGGYNYSDCTPTAGGGPNYNFYFGSTGVPIIPTEGAVPTKTLKLPDDYAIDGWGRRIFYAVTSDMTQENAFQKITVSDGASRMQILSPQQFPKVKKAIFVLVSTGPNGHGGYFRNATTLGSRISAGSTNTDEQQNCDCTDSAAATAMNGVYVQRDVLTTPSDRTNTHDDIVIFGTRTDFRLPGFIRVLQAGLNASDDGGSGGGQSCSAGCVWDGSQCQCGGDY